MSGGGVDRKEESLKRADAALVRAVDTCARLETKYDNAQTELKEHMRAYPGDTDSAMYKILVGALERAYAAYESAQRQLETAQALLARRQAGQAQAPQHDERIEDLSAQVAALNMAQQGTPPKRAAPGGFLTSPSKRSRTSVGSGDGTPRAPTGSLAWKLTFEVTNGARAPKLRNWLYRTAEDTIGFEHVIEYSRMNNVITSSSSLEGHIYYQIEHYARRMETLLIQECRKLGLALTTDVMETQHQCACRLSAMLYSANDSPNRADWQAGEVIESVPDTDACTSRLTAQEIKEESPVDYDVFALDNIGEKAEWAHIRERSECTTPAEVNDPNNRLIISPSFHAPYDGRAGESGVPRLSFVYLGNDPPQGKSEITLHVVFATAGLASDLSRKLKNPVFCGDRTYTCTLTHPNPQGFVVYLNERHNDNQALNPLLTPTERSDALIASQTTRDS